MKRIIIIAIMSLVITGCRGKDNTSVAVESLSPEEVNAQIEILHKLMIPPKGVSKADVDAVFGVPEEIKELPKGGKGSPTDYPMHIYQLLTPKQNQEFRAFLHVTYEDEKVKYIGINHICVSKGRPTYLQGSPQQIKQQQMIEMENVQVLEDLNEIQKKYENKLKDASWNK
jgi:hypothetical protein